jgi:DNA-directed RNA polymerase subunit RPC12/RpoP
MERSLNVLKLEVNSMPAETHDCSKCGTCGEEYKAPLFAVVSSGFLSEEYYACPKCLSKVGVVEQPKTIEADEEEVEEDKAEPFAMGVAPKMDDAVACAHQFGYLKRRPKNTPIPEECFTCTKMIDCSSC